MRESDKILLDAEMVLPAVEEVRDVTRERCAAAAVSDPYVWRVGRNSYACIHGLVTTTALSADEVGRQLATHEELVYATVGIAAASA